MFLPDFDVIRAYYWTEAHQDGTYLFYIIKGQKLPMMTSSKRLSSNTSQLRTNENARVENARETK